MRKIGRHQCVKTSIIHPTLHLCGSLRQAKQREVFHMNTISSIHATKAFFVQVQDALSNIHVFAPEKENYTTLYSQGNFHQNILVSL